MKSKFNIFINILFVLGLISAGFLLFVIIKNNLFPIYHRSILTIVAILIYLLLGLLILYLSHKSKFIYFLLCLILIMGTLIQTVAANYIGNTFKKIDNVDTTEKATYAVITRKSNTFDFISEINNSVVYYSKAEVKSEIDEVITSIKKANDKIIFNEGESMVELYKSLIESKLDYAIINLSLVNILEEDTTKFDEKVKILKFGTAENPTDNIEVEKEIVDIVKNVESGESFTVYISGGDSYYGLYSPTRADVNIVMTVNPKTHEILLTTIPRDSYVYIPGVGDDKLTHAGIYGIGTSVATIETLLGVEINYYAKVNFQSIINIVNALGGISVYNPQGFTSRVNGEYFPEGQITLWGDSALAFVRERYSLADGDLERGRNQMRVIRGIVNKLVSFDTLINYNNILEVGVNSVNTNFPSEKISELINGQLESKSGWDISTNEIYGYGQSGLPSASMPGYDLYMHVLDQGSVGNVSYEIQDLLNRN